ncbi:MAG: hypothetical protein WB853_03040, partial [Desulfobacterales bacterium]
IRHCQFQIIDTKREYCYVIRIEDSIVNDRQRLFRCVIRYEVFWVQGEKDDRQDIDFWQKHMTFHHGSSGSSRKREQGV